MQFHELRPEDYCGGDNWELELLTLKCVKTES